MIEWAPNSLLSTFDWGRGMRALYKYYIYPHGSMVDIYVQMPRKVME